jgi:hypothetical protein
VTSSVAASDISGTAADFAAYSQEDRLPDAGMFPSSATASERLGVPNRLRMPMRSSGKCPGWWISCCGMLALTFMGVMIYMMMTRNSSGINAPAGTTIVIERPAAGENADRYPDGSPRAEALQRPPIPALAPYQKPTVLFFAMKGCGHCQKFAPIWELVTGKVATKMMYPHVTFTKLEYDPDDKVDNYATLRKQLNIKGFPCLLVVRDGAEVARVTGLTKEIKTETSLTHWFHRTLTTLKHIHAPPAARSHLV